MDRTYGYYRMLSWCLALVPVGFGFFVLVGIVAVALAVPWALLKPKPLKKLDEISKSTGCLKGLLQITERCSHFLFENDSLKIQSSNLYGRVLIISGRTFELSFAVLSCLVFYNCIVLGIIFSVAMNYLVVHETSQCNDNYDCFVGKDTAYSAQPLTNCSKISDNNSIIKCYYIDVRPAVALSLVGGFLKIVPPMVFYATTTLYLILLKNFHWSIKVSVNVILLVIFVGALAVMSVVTHLRLTSYVYEKEERAAQVIVFLLLCICFTCWPWYVFECAKVEEKDEPEGPDGDLESRENLISFSK